MTLRTKALATALLLVAGAAFAEGTATEPNVVARKALMSEIGGAVKVLGEMAGDKVAFDAAAAETAKATLISHAGEIAAKFEMQAADPVSKAKPDIWANWDDFLSKASGLQAAVSTIDVASLDGIKAGMGAVGGACKACHGTYRMQ